MKRAKLDKELKRIQKEIEEEEIRVRSIVEKEKRRLCDKFGFEYVTSECVKRDDTVYYLSYNILYNISCVKIQYFSYLPIDIDFRINETCVINSEITLKGLHLFEFQKISESIILTVSSRRFFENFLNPNVDRIIMRNSIITVYPLLKSVLGKDVAQLICKLAWETKNGTATDC